MTYASPFLGRCPRFINSGVQPNRWHIYLDAVFVVAVATAEQSPGMPSLLQGKHRLTRPFRSDTA